jgi:nucleotide-binding universal stress UspA family protein
MYRRILIPLDGSSLAEQALPYGRVLAKALRIPVQLLKVIDVNELKLTTEGGKELYFQKLLDETLSSKTYLQAAAESFPKGQADFSIDEGNPAEVLIERASADRRALIVMATHGQNGIRRWLLGSVANTLLQSALNDMFLIRVTDEGRTAGEATLKTLLLPLDGSASAEQVFPAIEDLAKRIGLEVSLLGVCTGQAAVTHDPNNPFIDNAGHHQLEGELHAYLGSKAEELKRKGLVDIAAVVKSGYAAEQIIRTAENTRDGFVAVCMRGGSGRSGWVLGSVTNHVVRRVRRGRFSSFGDLSYSKVSDAKLEELAAAKKNLIAGK